MFLLTGLAGLLGVMATRLARVIDRVRMFESTWPEMTEKARAKPSAEIATLEQRRRVCSWSINYCTAAALFVCLVIITLFADAFSATDLKWLAGGLFVRR